MTKNSLQTEVLTLQPAVVEFNFQQIADYLDTQLKQYEGMVFDEGSSKELKRTVADLRKGKKGIDDFRKKTKTELTKSVTAFEKQCKLLNSKFDAVISPLSQQYEQFESDRIETKRKQITDLIDKYSFEQGLLERFSIELDVKTTWLNIGSKLKDIEQEIKTTSEHLGIKQDKWEADKKIIRTQIELINAKHGVNLPILVYERMLDYKTVEDIESQMDIDTEQMIEKQKIEADKRKLEAIEIKEDVGIKSMDDGTPEIFTDVWTVIGTEKQLQQLEDYADEIGVSIEVREDEV